MLPTDPREERRRSRASFNRDDEPDDRLKLVDALFSRLEGTLHSPTPSQPASLRQPRRVPSRYLGFKFQTLYLAQYDDPYRFDVLHLHAARNLFQPTDL
ncbi:hypothetical protein JCM21900_003404 [Sporobolomyces salmonicolor]